MIKPNSDQAKEDKTDQQKKIKQTNACYFTIRFETVTWQHKIGICYSIF